MEIIDHLRNRRSIRKFLPKPVEDEKIKKLIEAASLSPSSKNQQSWKFYIVKDKEIIKKLSETQKYSNFLENAPLTIVITSDEELSPYHFVEDASIAAFSILLEASSLGLGACWNAVYLPGTQRREEYVRNIIKIPKKYRVICNIGVGYPDEKPKEKTVKDFEEVSEII